jgi:hypothetical protein
MELIVSNDFAKLLEIITDTEIDINYRSAAFNYVMFCMEEDASMIMFAKLGLNPDFVGEQPDNYDLIMQDIQMMTNWLSVFCLKYTINDLKNLVESEDFFNVLEK